MTKTLTQQRLALARANEVRRSNSRTCQELRGMDELGARRRTVQLLEAPDEYVGALPIERLLLACPGMGQKRLRRVLHHAQVYSAGRRVRDLTHRQRAVIAETLRDPHILEPGSRKPSLSLEGEAA